MAVGKRKSTGKYFYRVVVKLPDGTKKRLTEGGFAKAAEAKAAEHEAVEKAKAPKLGEVPTFGQWFNGRFWTEWVIGGPRGRNKPTEQESKRSIFNFHLKDFFGGIALNRIDVALINTFRANLIAKELSPKRVNNIMAVLSKALRYAHDVGLLDRMPKVGVIKVERPDPEIYEFEEWAALVLACITWEEKVAVSLAGEHGLRVGEVRALRMSDIDVRARTLTIAQDVYDVKLATGLRQEVFGTPKGRTRRTIPMSPTLHALLRDRLPHGYILAGREDGPDGKFMGVGEARWLMQKLGRRAGLHHRIPFGAWHILRHTYATYCARFGANPWSLNQWMGHKTMEETMLYVAFAKAHMRETPAGVLAAAESTTDPDRRIPVMLAAVAGATAPKKRGTDVAPKAGSSKQNGGKLGS